MRADAQEIRGAVAEADSLRQRNGELEQERRMLEDRLENAKTVAENAKRKGQEAEDQVRSFFFMRIISVTVLAICSFGVSR